MAASRTPGSAEGGARRAAARSWRSRRSMRSRHWKAGLQLQLKGLPVGGLQLVAPLPMDVAAGVWPCGTTRPCRSRSTTLPRGGNAAFCSAAVRRTSHHQHDTATPPTTASQMRRYRRCERCGRWAEHRHIDHRVRGVPGQDTGAAKASRRRGTGFARPLASSPAGGGRREATWQLCSKSALFVRCLPVDNVAPPAVFVTALESKKFCACKPPRPCAQPFVERRPMVGKAHCAGPCTARTLHRPCLPYRALAAHLAAVVVPGVPPYQFADSASVELIPNRAGAINTALVPSPMPLPSMSGLFCAKCCFGRFQCLIAVLICLSSSLMTALDALGRQRVGRPVALCHAHLHQLRSPQVLLLLRRSHLEQLVSAAVQRKVSIRASIPSVLATPSIWRIHAPAWDWPPPRSCPPGTARVHSAFPDLRRLQQHHGPGLQVFQGADALLVVDKATLYPPRPFQAAWIRRCPIHGF